MRRRQAFGALSKRDSDYYAIASISSAIAHDINGDSTAEECLVDPLSDRELEVLKLIAAGLSNKKISAGLYISLSTVKTHLRSIYGKLDAHSRTEAIVKAKQFGLLK